MILHYQPLPAVKKFQFGMAVMYTPCQLAFPPPHLISHFLSSSKPSLLLIKTNTTYILLLGLLRHLPLHICKLLIIFVRVTVFDFAVKYFALFYCLTKNYSCDVSQYHIKKSLLSLNIRFSFAKLFKKIYQFFFFFR